MNLARRMTTFVAAAAAFCALLVAPAGAQQSEMARALSMLPADANTAMAFNLEAFGNQQSLLSYFPRAELIQFMGAQLAEEGPGSIASASEAAAAVAMALPDISGKVKAVAIGYRVGSPDQLAAGAIPQEYAVVLGDFTAAEVGPTLRPLGIGPGPSATTAILQTPGMQQLFVGLPADGMVLISASSEWIDAASGLASNNAGLTAQGGNFAGTFSAAATSPPDIMLYADGQLVRQTAQADPGMAMMFGALLQARGFLVTTQPAATPAVRVSAVYADDQAAALGGQFFQQLLQMARGFVQPMIGQMVMAQAQQIQDPELRQQFMAEAEQKIAEGMKRFDSIRTGSSGRAAYMHLPLEDLPDRAEVRQQIIDMLEQGDDFDFGSLFAPGM